MKWLELHLDTQPAGIEPATELLSEYGIDSLMIDEEGDFKDFLENNHQYWDFGSHTVTDNIGTTGNIGYTLKVISTSGTRYDVTGGLFSINITEQ